MVHIDPNGRAPRDRSDRGQTAQDFALGVGIFMVTIAFVFAVIPSTLTISSADPGAVEGTHAERTASSILADLSLSGQVNELNGTETADYFNATTNGTQVRNDHSLPVTAQINVTIRALGGTGPVTVTDSNGTAVSLTAGDPYQEQSAAEIVRIVRLTADGGACDPACELVVLTW